MMSEAAWVNFLIITFLLSFAAIFFLKAKGKGIITIITVIIFSLLTGFHAVRSLTGTELEIVLSGTTMFGDVPLRIDALSGWFILVINFTMLTGTFYGLNYMKKYRERESDLTFHCMAWLLVHLTLVGVCAIQNSFIFLLFWEILALAVFILVIFDSSKPGTVKAGLNYLVQSHISIVLLMMGFIYYAFKTNSYSFDAIRSYSSGQSSLEGTAMFLLFFIGFALKAGFIPFHTWLPYAHPAAPSHVSGIMSGVVIKIGIFGILRMLLLMKVDYLTVGYFILILSVLTGLYGVMLATIQHDLKKLLAYHSIENIGIIGIGIGIGCIGLGSANKWMAILGFSGAMLHTLNHSLFKSLLFYSAGNVLQAIHSLNVESLGGLIKKMPRTALLFLFAAVAICGLPPLNGFISEFLIYAGLYNWIHSAGMIPLIILIFSLTGLVLIGGLAVLCFTKAFSIVFLGSPRSEYPEDVHETSPAGLIPMYFTAALMAAIGLFPLFFLKALQQPVNLFTAGTVFNLNLIKVQALDSLKVINWLFMGFIVLVLAIAALRKYSARNKVIEQGPTWGCGYPVAGGRLQYTATSYVRSYTKIAKPALDIEKNETAIDEVFPQEKHYEAHSYDKLERILIDKPLKLINKVLDAFLFLQNGRLQRYILYGIIFITSVLCLPLLVDKIRLVIHILNSL